MSPKEKAEQLVAQYRGFGMQNENIASKQCALIAVDEVMYQLNVLPYGMEYLSHIDYWEEVKQEIQKL
jgi:hypothetical protein